MRRKEKKLKIFKLINVSKIYIKITKNHLKYLIFKLEQIIKYSGKEITLNLYKKTIYNGLEFSICEELKPRFEIIINLNIEEVENEQIN